MRMNSVLDNFSESFSRKEREFSQANASTQRGALLSCSTITQVRMIPLAGAYKLNVDGAIFKEDKAIGVGGVLRDHNGDVFMAFSERIQGGFEPIIAESLAVFRGLQICGYFGIRDVVMESDSTILMAINS
ncbi:uncharacterized protein LOC119998589 [Tripterygium wilfordii]|uniref:uncharacterized protein LOC119998589 n=1 Tax=Tripterygium wilfordii TaxID=458696 RepID=UPI0018F7EBD1|nr:uncharacterized protein LOC119998589 [Tripterygium wilfordii]